jgi:hypothetical protein
LPSFAENKLIAMNKVEARVLFNQFPKGMTAKSDSGTVTHIPYTSHAGRRKGRCRKEEGSIRVYIASVGETLSSTHSTNQVI